MQVLSKELKEHGYYKKKGLVKKLASKFVGQIAMLDTGDVLQVRFMSCVHAVHALVKCSGLAKTLLKGPTRRIELPSSQAWVKMVFASRGHDCSSDMVAVAP